MKNRLIWLMLEVHATGSLVSFDKTGLIPHFYIANVLNADASNDYVYQSFPMSLRQLTGIGSNYVNQAVECQSKVGALYLYSFISNDASSITWPASNVYTPDIRGTSDIAGVEFFLIPPAPSIDISPSLKGLYEQCIKVYYFDKDTLPFVIKSVPYKMLKQYSGVRS